MNLESVKAPQELASRNRLRKATGRIAVSLILLLLVFSQISWREISLEWDHIDWLVLILASSLLWCVGTWFKVLRLGVLLAAQNIVIPFSFLIKLHLRRIFVGIVLPVGGVAGDLYGVYIIGKLKNTAHKVLSAALVERVTGLFALLIIAWTGLLHILFVQREHSLLLVGPLIVASGVFMSGVVIGFTFTKYSGLINKVSLPLQLTERINKFFQTLPRYIYDWKTAATIFLYSLISQASLVIWAGLAARSLGYSLTFDVVCVVIPLTVIVTMMPISFNGLGVQEATYALLLTPFGLSVTEAVSFSLLFTFVETRICFFVYKLGPGSSIHVNHSWIMFLHVS